MKQRTIMLLLATVALTARNTPGSLPPLPDRGKALVIGGKYFPWEYNGTYTPRIRVIFLKLDNAASPSGTTLSLDPGHHTLEVRCEVADLRSPPDPEGAQVLPSSAVFDVEADMTYDAIGRLNANGRFCFVAVHPRS
jgi:hypothetical protein